MPFSRLGPLDSSFSTDMAVGELVDPVGKPRAVGQTWGMAGDEVSKKGWHKTSSRYLYDDTVNKKFR
jgi:hypothetical protein